MRRRTWLNILHSRWQNLRYCAEELQLVLRVPVPEAGAYFSGLHWQQGDMDNWWTQNQAHVKKSGIASVAHACITTMIMCTKNDTWSPGRRCNAASSTN
ncbi:hypothetical protein K503DRAFT_726635 [Rhizopogon vinicolor AM-OR11-026]|uniref:Uncharacterized protein n=1 Tax=Rhizopogon vinicolor AM-OR11-026 TaxID=1314800 RepID=A0A1B7MJM7_9AGAM|nr:hypothetical protein K503DRAFT_726635 [Rhizopogon vinicolor AM-OR11-026]